MSNTVIATGYQAQIAFAKETTYGTSPTSSAYSWYGQVEQASITVDRQPIVIYRMDGSTPYPAHILYGTRKVDTTVDFYPQDVGALTDMINNVVSSSHSTVINFGNIGQAYTAFGGKANKVTFTGAMNAALKCQIAYQNQNVSTSAPVGITYPSDPGNTPFYFATESISLSNSLNVKVIDWNVTITRNLQRVYQFGQDYLRVLTPLVATATGDFTVVLEDFTELSDVFNWSPETLSFTLGQDAGNTTRYCNITGAQLTQVPLTAPVQDYIEVKIPFTATGVTIV